MVLLQPMLVLEIREALHLLQAEVEHQAKKPLILMFAVLLILVLVAGFAIKVVQPN